MTRRAIISSLVIIAMLIGTAPVITSASHSPDAASGVGLANPPAGTVNSTVTTAPAFDKTPDGGFDCFISKLKIRK